ncbi:MAG TPA: LuxR C-terminal-related transcriptional regulator [Tardiphaga sp.]
MSQQQISALVDDIFDAGLDPARWDDVVVGINRYVGGKACGLFSKNPINKCGTTHYFCGADPHYIRLYAETYCKFDPLGTLPRFGQVVSIPDLVDYGEYRAGRFYQEWLSPQGCVDAANVVLENSNPNFPVLLTVLSGRHMVDGDTRRRIEKIVPHLHRALRINRTIDAKQSEAGTFAGALNGLTAGVFLVDAHCGLVHANSAGHDLLRSGDLLSSVGGRLALRDPRQNQALRKRISDDMPIHVDEPVVPLSADGGEHYVLHILPVQSVVRMRTGLPGRAVAALFIRRAALDSESCAGLVARSFQMTPAESRVLLAIVQSGGVPDTAKMLGIAETTVKTHLNRIFAKTGVSRQTDLIRLTAGYASPLAS